MLTDSAPLINAGGSGAGGGSTRDTLLGERTRVTLTWQHLSYTVVLPKSKETRQILTDVSGYAHSGQMLAILGPSGAGKTTMLDILARRAKGGTISGDLLMNGHPVDDGVFRRVTAYVQQEDIMHGFLTVRETIAYSAKLRLPDTHSAEDIEQRVTLVMQLLGIEHIADSKIGNDNLRGISGGEKKRTAIAVELVTGPSMIFLDEPTTGLDTFTALHLMYLLKKLAAQGTTIILSIHQPRSSIFRLFDSVLLLNGWGNEAYFGPADRAVEFLVSAGVPNKFPDNPADFLLDSVAVVRAAEALDPKDFPFIPPRTQADDVAANFRSTLLDDVNRRIDATSRAFVSGSNLPPALSSPYFRSVWTQIHVVSARATINKMRDPVATIVAFFVAIFFALLVGSIYWQMKLDQSGINDRLGVMFFLTMNTAFSSLGSLAIFLFERNIYVREHRNGMYRPSAYFIGKIVQDVPFALFVNLAFDATAYYMVGLQPSFYKFCWFYLIMVLIMLNSFTMCMWMSNLSPNIQVANIVAPLLMVLFLLPSGFLINLNSLPVYWRWLKYVSFVRFGYEALVINEFEGLTFTCDRTPLAIPGMNMTNATTIVTQCCYDGLECVDQQLGFKASSFHDNMIYTSVSIGVYLVLGYLCLRFLRSKEGK